MAIIHVDQLSKDFKVPQKKEGLKNSIHFLFKKEFKNVNAVMSIPMQKCILFGNSEHPFPEKQSIPFRSRVQLMISTQVESLYHVM